jgi:hypothetical protein
MEIKVNLQGSVLKTVGVSYVARFDVVILFC